MVLLITPEWKTGQLCKCKTPSHKKSVLLTTIRPVEILDLHIKPADFFTANPAIDVPGRKNFTSQLTNAEKAEESSCCADSKPRL